MPRAQVTLADVTRLPCTMQAAISQHHNLVALRRSSARSQANNTMDATFDPHDETSWNFGCLSHGQANAILMTENESGVFLVRDSSIQGDLVLCVRESNGVKHYIINKIVETGKRTMLRIGKYLFTDVPSLLIHFTRHRLDTTTLKRPAKRKLERVRGSYDFTSCEIEYLPFRKGEILRVISKNSNQYWTAASSLGQIGLIPINEKHEETDKSRSPFGPTLMDIKCSKAAAEKASDYMKLPALPAAARVIRDRVCPYQQDALKLREGDVVLVTHMNPNGQWIGELNGKVGTLPFTFVKFIDSDENYDKQSS